MMKPQVCLLILRLRLKSGEGRSANLENFSRFAELALKQLSVRRNACYRGWENRHRLFTSVYYLSIIQLRKYLIEQHWNKSVTEGSKWGSSIVLAYLFNNLWNRHLGEYHWDWKILACTQSAIVVSLFCDRSFMCGNLVYMEPKWERVYIPFFCYFTHYPFQLQNW